MKTRMMVIFCLLGSFAVAQDDISDEQVTQEMKTYLSHLNGKETSESHLNQQLEFIKKIIPIWKISEFRKLRAMALTDLINIPSKESYSYYFLAIAFHEENIEEHSASISEPKIIDKIIQFREQLRAMSHFVILSEISNLPKDSLVREIKFSPQNSDLSFVTSSSLYLLNTQTLSLNSIEVHEAIPIGPSLWGYSHLALSTATFSRDERWIAIGTRAGLVKIIDRQNPSYRCILPKSYEERERGQPITSLAFSPNSNYLAIATSERTFDDETDYNQPIVQLYTADHERNFKFLAKRDNSYEIHGLAFCSDGHSLVGRDQFSIPVWSIGGKKPLFSELSSNRHDAYTVYISNLDDKYWGATCVGNERISRYKIEQSEIGSIELYDQKAFDCDPKTELIAYSNDRNILYAKRSKLSPRTQIFQTECEINDIVISPDASMIGVVSYCLMETSFQDHVHLFKKQTEPDWNLLLLINPDTLRPTSGDRR